MIYKLLNFEVHYHADIFTLCRYYKGSAMQTLNCQINQLERPENLMKISRTLGVSADYLLSGETTEDNLRFSAVADKLKLLSEEKIQAVLNLIDVMKKQCV